MEKIPEYLKEIENGRYECIACKKTVSALFADLGCACNGQGRSENFEDIKERLLDIMDEIQDLPENEREELVDIFSDELA